MTHVVSSRGHEWHHDFPPRPPFNKRLRIMRTVASYGPFDDSTDHWKRRPGINICLGPGEKLRPEKSRLCKFSIARARQNTRIYLSSLSSFLSSLLCVFNSPVSLLGVNAPRLSLCEMKRIKKMKTTKFYVIWNYDMLQCKFYFYTNSYHTG